MAINGKKIRSLRKESKLTQDALGKKLGVVKQTVSSWENNVSEPTNETLSALAKLFNVSIDYLLDCEDSAPPATESELEWRYAPSSNRFGTILMKYRKSNGLSEKDFADKLKIDVETYMGIEIGKYTPTMDLLKSLSGTTGYDLDYLIGATDHTVVPASSDASRPLNLFESNSHFRTKFEELCRRDLITIDNVQEKLDLTMQEFNDIRCNRMPTLRELLRIVYGCKVSLDYLLGITSADEERVLDAYMKLDEDNRDIIMGEMKKCIKEQERERRLREETSAEPAPFAKEA